MVADRNRRGYQGLLEQFWQNALSWGLPLPQDKPVSAAAFCKARLKLPGSLLRELLKSVHGQLVARFGSQSLWKGRRVYAIDGCKFNLKRTEELEIEFRGSSGGHLPQVLVCTLYDLLAEIPVAQVELPYDAGERDSLDTLLEQLKPGDLLILDRGYPSFDVFQKLLERGIDFLIRVPNSFKNLTVTRHDRTVECPPRKRGAQPLSLRTVRSEVNGSSQYFVTTLSKEEATHNDLLELYHQRWQVEEFYKVLKGDLSQGNFRSQTPDGVIQELLLAALYAALSRYLIAAAQVSHPVPTDSGHLHDSFKAASLALADALATLILATAREQREDTLQRLLDRIARARTKVRPGRSFPRRSWQPQPRWGPAGRNRGSGKG